MRCWPKSGEIRGRVRGASCSGGLCRASALTRPPLPRFAAAADGMLANVDPERAGQLSFDQFLSLLAEGGGSGAFAAAASPM